MFSLSGGRLTQRLRMDSFAAVLSQEIGWFDRYKLKYICLNFTLSLCKDLRTVLALCVLGYQVMLQKYRGLLVQELERYYRLNFKLENTA